MQTGKARVNGNISSIIYQFTKTGRYSKRPSINYVNSDVWFVSESASMKIYRIGLLSLYLLRHSSKKNAD